MLNKYVSSRFTVLIVSMVHFTLLPTPVAALSVIPISVNETAQLASDIVLGTVIDRKSYWTDASHRWMQTDFTLKVDDVIYTSDTSRAIQGTIILSYWGGSISGETHGIAGMYMPKANERLLVMLTPDWQKNKYFSPTVGINQGIFSVADDTSLLYDGDGLPIALEKDGSVKRGRIKSEFAKDSPNMNLYAFTNWLRANISRIKAAPLPQRADSNRDDPRLMKLFSKTPKEPGVKSAISPRTSLPLSDVIQLAEPVIPNIESFATADDVVEELMTSDGISHLKYSATLWATVPIVVNQFPASMSPWSPVDQDQMAKWNYYADIFKVYETPTNTFSWGDRVFDNAGWVSSSDLHSTYNTSWGNKTLATTFYSCELDNIADWLNIEFCTLSNHIVEADIALNPAFDWTLDDEWVYNGGDVQPFRQTMIHELGHVLGLDHNFNYLSLMNYFPGPFRAYSIPFMDDAQGIRAIYPNQTIGRSDLAIYLFYASGEQSVTDATFPKSVTAGDSLTVSDYHVENVGTTTIATPTIEWYLTAERNFSGAYYGIGTSTYSSLEPFTSFTTSTVAKTFTVPATIPAGDYYLAAFIRGDGGVGSGSFCDNNNAFSRFKITVMSPTTSQYSLNVTLSGSGSGIVTDPGIDCGTDCSEFYDAGTAITLHALPTNGSNFTGWNGACTNTNDTCNITMNANQSVTATFITSDIPNNPKQFLKNQLSGRCIDVPNELGGGNGATLQIHDCEESAYNNGLTDQLWYITNDGFIVNSLNNKCIDVDGLPGTTNGARLHLWDCEWSGYNSGTQTDQRWRITSGGFIVNNLSNKCIDVAGAPGTTNGASLLLWDCELSGTNSNGTTTDQRWSWYTPTSAPSNISTTGVFHPVSYSSYTFLLRKANTAGSADATINNYGLPGDKPISGDWNGDGISTIGVFRNGTFYLRNSNTDGTADIVFVFGQAGDLPVAGDWNGDGVDTIGVYRNGVFLLRDANSAGDSTYSFGLGISGDQPLGGDWTNKGFDSTGVFRPSNGALYLKNSNTTGYADMALTYGIPGDKPITGDWDGDGTDTIGVYRDGVFMLRNSNTLGYADIYFSFGTTGDEPISGIWGIK